jgi:multisubunit Na+/H+ antiporter MnhC subunit
LVASDERILRITVAIGITLILASLLGSGRFGFYYSLDPGAYTLSVFRATGDIYVTASSPTNQSFSLYVLDSDNALMALQDSSLEGTVQLVALENITQYSGTVSIPSTGVYAVLVTPSGNDTATIDVNISRLYPVPSLLVLGSILVAIGLTAMGMSHLAQRKQETKNVLETERTSSTTPGTESQRG